MNHHARGDGRRMKLVGLIVACAAAAMVAAGPATGPRAGAMAASGTADLLQRRAPATEADARQRLEQRWGDRLRTLDPARPMAYFELAEEIDDRRRIGPAAAGDAVARAERELVRELFALAGRLDPSLTSAAARAIADLTADVRERRRLLVVADLLDGDRILRGRAPRIEGVPTGRGSAAPAEVLRSASAAIARYRRGDGEASLEAIAGHPREQVQAAFAPWPGGLAGFEQDCRRQPGGVRVRRLLAELSAELRMLEGDGADWAAIVRAGGGAPLEEVDVTDLDRLFAIDAAKTIWRDGGWVTR